VQVQLLALNDFHGKSEPPSGSTGAIDRTPAGGVERLATLLADLSAENGTSNTITVAAGDLIGVSPLLSAAFHDEPSVEALCSGTRVPDDTVRIGGAPVDAGATYRITVSSFLADGGNGFGVLRSGSNRAVSGLAVDTFAQYLSADRPISAPATDRIRTAGSAPDGS
jgi:2',3'-cyclic-nucleotide 2'-phosphodiesterase (5'-nucleotidase family)